MKNHFKKKKLSEKNGFFEGEVGRLRKGDGGFPRSMNATLGYNGYATLGYNGYIMYVCYV
jgi:hypothetical protein